MREIGLIPFKRSKSGDYTEKKFEILQRFMGTQRDYSNNDSDSFSSNELNKKDIDVKNIKKENNEIINEDKEISINEKKSNNKIINKIKNEENKNDEFTLKSRDSKINDFKDEEKNDEENNSTVKAFIKGENKKRDNYNKYISYKNIPSNQKIDNENNVKKYNVIFNSGDKNKEKNDDYKSLMIDKLDLNKISNKGNKLENDISNDDINQNKYNIKNNKNESGPVVNLKLKLEKIKQKRYSKQYNNNNNNKSKKEVNKINLEKTKDINNKEEENKDIMSWRTLTYFIYRLKDIRNKKFTADAHNIPHKKNKEKEKSEIKKEENKDIKDEENKELYKNNKAKDNQNLIFDNIKEINIKDEDNSKIEDNIIKKEEIINNKSYNEIENQKGDITKENQNDIELRNKINQLKEKEELGKENSRENLKNYIIKPEEIKSNQIENNQVESENIKNIKNNKNENQGEKENNGQKNNKEKKNRK